MAKLLSDPDSALVKDQMQALNAVLTALGAAVFCQSMFWILPKHSKIIPFRFNLEQGHLFPRLARNNRVLKARQVGMTTFFLLVRLFLNCITKGGTNGLLINYNNKYAHETFVILRRAYRLIGAVDPYDNEQNALCTSLRANLLHTTYSNRRELVFDQLDSKILVESAEVEEAGQSITLHHVVASEVARWPGNPEATTSNIKGALVPGGTYDEESTGNGAAGYFYEQYLRSLDNEKEADARAHFYEWYWDLGYTKLLTKAEEDELILDLQADELALIAKMHKDLGEVTWPKVAA